MKVLLRNTSRSVLIASSLWLRHGLHADALLGMPLSQWAYSAQSRSSLSKLLCSLVLGATCVAISWVSDAFNADVLLLVNTMVSICLHHRYVSAGHIHCRLLSCPILSLRNGFAPLSNLLWSCFLFPVFVCSVEDWLCFDLVLRAGRPALCLLLLLSSALVRGKEGVFSLMRTFVAPCHHCLRHSLACGSPLTLLVQNTLLPSSCASIILSVAMPSAEAWLTACHRYLALAVILYGNLIWTIIADG